MIPIQHELSRSDSPLTTSASHMSRVSRVFCQTFPAIRELISEAVLRESHPHAYFTSELMETERIWRYVEFAGCMGYVWYMGYMRVPIRHESVNSQGLRGVNHTQRCGSSVGRTA